MAADVSDKHSTPTTMRLVSVALTREQWKKAAAYLDWHGKDRESELIVGAIREQADVE